MAITDLKELLADLKADLKPDTYVFCSVQKIPQGLTCLASFIESEGISVICTQADADANQLSYDTVMRLITLEVYSSLEAVGMTAAISRVLTEAGISANVVAAYHHDYLFVPQDKAERALQLLNTITRYL